MERQSVRSIEDGLDLTTKLFGGPVVLRGQMHEQHNHSNGNIIPPGEECFWRAF